MADQPTPQQRAVLELISEFEALRTAQIHEYLPENTKIRALQALLARIQAKGWIEGAPLYPAHGKASEYYWLLSPAGAAVLELSGDRRRPALTRLQQTLAPGQPAIPLVAVSTAVLELLADWKQLTTGQIWQYLHPTCPRWYTQQVLESLAARHLIHGQDLNPEDGAASEHYWTLLERGARQIGLVYENHYRRRPTAATIRYRGLQLDLIRQVEAAGWTLIRPDRYSPDHPRPDETPQVCQLVEAVLAVEEQTLTAQLAAGVERWRLQERIDRLRAGKVGAVVPPAVNDYVAYIPTRPELTTVLIPHPPNAARSFWTRKPDPQGDRPEQRGRRDSRLARYERLAKILPIVAVFDTSQPAARYVPVLALAGFRCILATEVGAQLANLH